jgi:dihydroflavonol-4-reductase
VARAFLVTGATGFLGRHLVARLRLDPAVAVRVLARGATPWDADAGVEVVRGDVLDRRALDRAVAGVAGIFHLAGLVTRDPGRAGEIDDLHVRGTRHVCEAALAAGRPRVVLCSSSGTVAAGRAPVVHTEDAPYANDVAAEFPYYLSKIYQEKLALACGARGLPVVVLRPSLLLGPGDERLSSTGDVKAFLDGYIRTIPAGGLNFVDARDAAAAVAAAMEAGVPGRAYLIGGHNVTMREFFALLAQVSGMRAPALAVSERSSRRGAALGRALYRAAGRRFPLDDGTVAMAYRFWYLDNARARAELGFTARPAEETLRDTVTFLRARAAPAPGSRR